MEPAELVLVAFFFLLVGLIYSLIYGLCVIFKGFWKAWRAK